MQYLRSPAVSATEVDKEIFLIESNSDEIYHLDEIGSGVWRLLEEPCTPDELVDTFVTTFPDIPVQRIRQDLEKVVEDMLRAEVIKTVK